MYGKVFFKNYYYEFISYFEKKFYGISTCSYLKSLFQEICKIIFKILFDNLLCRQELKLEVVNWNFNLHNTKNRVHLYRSLQIVRVKKNSFTEYLSYFSPRSVTRYTEGWHTYGTFPLDIYIRHLTLFCISDKNIPINPSHFFIMYCRMKR